MVKIDLVDFWTTCSINNIVIDKKQMPAFERFYNELLYWNDKINLISRKDLENIYEHHFLHSLTILKYIDIKQRANCLDIGTGGGFPGIPLSIARPDLHLLLVDSIAKKIKATSMFAAHTGNIHLSARNCRVEELHAEKDKVKSFDYVFARAVTRTKSLLEWSKPLLKESGKVILLKGGNLAEEIAEAKAAFPEFIFEETAIDIIGCPWFKTEEKKILLCSKKQ